MRRDADVAPGRTYRIAVWKSAACNPGIDEPAEAAGVPPAKGAGLALWNARGETPRPISLTRAGKSTQGPQWSPSRIRSRSGSQAEAPRTMELEKHAPGETAVSTAKWPSAPKQRTLPLAPPVIARERTRKMADGTDGIPRKRVNTSTPCYKDIKV